MRLAPDGVLLLRLAMKVSYWHFDGACRGELDFIFDIDRFARRGPVRLPGLGFFKRHAPVRNCRRPEDCRRRCAHHIVGERRVPDPVAPDQGYLRRDERSGLPALSPGTRRRISLSARPAVGGVIGAMLRNVETEQMGGYSAPPSVELARISVAGGPEISAASGSQCAEGRHHRRPLVAELGR
jgi:hypothetical protein